VTKERLHLARTRFGMELTPLHLSGTRFHLAARFRVLKASYLAIALPQQEGDSALQKHFSTPSSCY
jgi:hypothetical protein